MSDMVIRFNPTKGSSESLLGVRDDENDGKLQPHKGFV